MATAHADPWVGCSRWAINDDQEQHWRGSKHTTMAANSSRRLFTREKQDNNEHIGLLRQRDAITPAASKRRSPLLIPSIFETSESSVLQSQKSSSSSSAAYITSSLSSALSLLIHYSTETPVGVAIASAATTATSFFLYRRYFRRLKSVADITPRQLRWRRQIVGVVTNIGDADGFRLYHQPGPPLLRSLLFPVPSTPKGLKDQTLSIRLAGADAPESGHFGHQPQPFAKEAKAHLTSLVAGKKVRLEVGHIDQYSRLVATPFVWRPPYIFGSTNVSLSLVQNGLATVYRQAGASYGSATWWRRWIFATTNGLSRLERAEKKARRKKLGIWSLGKKMETPEMYKKRIKGE